MNYAVFEFLDKIRPGEYPLEFLVGVCAPSSPNRDPSLDQKMPFFTSVSYLASKIHTCFQT